MNYRSAAMEKVLQPPGTLDLPKEELPQETGKGGQIREG